MQKYKGKRVLIIGDHPHTGHSGVVSSVETTAIGKTMIRVELDNGLSAGVFDESNLQIA